MPVADDTMPLSAALEAEVEAQRAFLIETTQKLVAVASPNPPGDVTAVAEMAAGLLQTIEGIRIARYETAPGIVNLVAVIPGAGPGRRLVFNGHLDTFPVGEGQWTVPPLGGTLKDGRIYGRGVSDMKAGIAATLTAVRILARLRDRWRGELVVTLAGDEENMGSLGSRWLLENVPEAKGDAMLCGDVGSPMVVRFGEKGLCWVELEAVGQPAHGAHVHKGHNAIDRLRRALDGLKRLEDLPVEAPASVSSAVAAAKTVSEPLSGEGEAETLQRVTVNIGTIEGGISPNLVPAQARAAADIRLPVGVNLETIEAALHRELDVCEGVTWRIIRAYPPTFTPPDHEIVQRTVAAATKVFGKAPVSNMRVGASDARLYRMFGVPSVVFGCTPFNMGAPDEYILVEELIAVAKVHTLAAFGFLSEA
ncbi:M20/M25/M40 family metallo-hydrolase [Bradyrhizobium erythrophlei]|uniref:Acetylornithine deacetylase/Succinyl-diaminopimelate desuccinylase n=1 Tax=Bradyrhizobium erythrophlei TaxID=1437360 RepID=A0A1M7UVT9_9BRAD|nr:M20/M25/M40 family metallo-hydrolase [Bradyrhizobium erythrophlei]SHN87055.1 Acetylornithine deacetylase/Succinyl-diaminopimelate desuccinylase [Bradyrhizobium erythrophlei]